MLAPNAIISLDQGKDLAHWQISRLYAEPEQKVEEIAPEAVAVPEPSQWRRILAAFAGVVWAMRRRSIPERREREVAGRLGVS